MTRDSDTMVALLVAGLLLLYLGVPLLIGGVQGYFYARKLDEALNEKAHEIGMQDIPGVGSPVGFFLALLIVGFTFTLAGSLCTALGLFRWRRIKSGRSGIRKRPPDAKPPHRTIVSANPEAPHKVALGKKREA